jgi:hypothetical protein
MVAPTISSWNQTAQFLRTMQQLKDSTGSPHAGTTGGKSCSPGGHATMGNRSVSVANDKLGGAVALDHTD